MNPTSAAHPVASWPSAAAALGEVYASQWLRRVKYTVRRWTTRHGRRIVMDHVAQSTAAQSLLANAPRAFYPVMHKHLDRRFTTLARARSVMQSMRCMEAAVGAGVAARLFGGEVVTLGMLPDTTRITLGLNRLTFHEGLWAIDLTRADGLRLFTVSFGWLDPDKVMLGCVQGPPREIDGLACVRELTDTAQGLRPAFLLMLMLRACATTWKVTRLVGVDEANQVKGRWNHRAADRRFDYAAFWQDCAGAPMPDGNWELPVDVPRRALDDVPSKRRAMYRRRYALIDALAAEVVAVLA